MDKRTSGCATRAKRVRTPTNPVLRTALPCRALQGWNDMQADLSHVWVVEFYADWCGHCKAFAPKFEKAATNLAGLVKFGGVNADSAKTLVKDAGVLSFPTVKIYLPELTTNPYTGS